MRVARLEACGDDRGREQFVGAFASRGLTASSSRLSRWEYGRSDGSHRLLRAYEEGTDMPPFLLFALNDRRRRATDNSFGVIPSIDLTGGVTAEDVYEILDRAVSSGDVSGSEWYMLAAFTASNGYFYLAPHNTSLFARRLIEELARSIGPAYVLRFEALHLFASMPRVHDALVDALMDMLEGGTTGSIGDAISLILRAGPEMRHKFVDRLRKSQSPMVRQSSAWIQDVLRDRRPDLAPVIDHQRVSAHADAVCRALPTWAMAHLEEDMTAPLVTQAIGGRSRLQRHEASLLLMLARVEEHVCEQILDSFEKESDPILRTRLANLHEYLLPAGDPDRLLGLALDETEPETRRSLWGSRAHTLQPIELTGPIRRALDDPDAQYAVSHALGFSGSIDAAMLAEDRSDQGLRDVLQWWRSRGPGLLV